MPRYLNFTIFFPVLSHSDNAKKVQSLYYNKVNNYMFVKNVENLQFFYEKKCGNVWWFWKKSYLCIRFRSKTSKALKKSSLKDLHRQK